MWFSFGVNLSKILESNCRWFGTPWRSCGVTILTTLSVLEYMEREFTWLKYNILVQTYDYTSTTVIIRRCLLWYHMLYMYWCSYKTIHKHTTVCTYIFNEHFPMNPSHESHRALDKYSKMHYFVTEMHTHGHEHIFVTNRAFFYMGVIHCVICARSLLRTSGWVFLYRLTMPREVQILLNQTMDFLCITNISNMLLLMKKQRWPVKCAHSGPPRIPKMVLISLLNTTSWFGTHLRAISQEMLKKSSLVTSFEITNLLFQPHLPRSNELKRVHSQEAVGMDQ